MIENQSLVTKDWEGRKGLITKRLKRTFGGDGNFLYLDLAVVMLLHSFAQIH